MTIQEGLYSSIDSRQDPYDCIASEALQLLPEELCMIPVD